MSYFIFRKNQIYKIYFFFMKIIYILRYFYCKKLSDLKIFLFFGDSISGFSFQKI